MGSDANERAQAIQDLAATAPKFLRFAYAWVARELPRQTQQTGGFAIMRYAVTHAQYHRFIVDTGRFEPYVAPETWAQMQTQLPYAQVQAQLWTQGRPSPEQARRPVTLVSHQDASDYCRWWGTQRGTPARLPTEAEWERTARGDQGQAYPWGSRLEIHRLNAFESAIAHSTPVSTFASGQSPHGAVGMAGNVLEWTQSPDPKGGYIVKGGAFSMAAAMARPAARHARPASARHIALGFRCVVPTASPAKKSPSRRTRSTTR